MEIKKIDVGDLLQMKKPHPCGDDIFRVVRVGSDVRIICCRCDRDLTLDRVKLEKSVKKVISKKEKR